MNFVAASEVSRYDKENRTHAKEYLLTYKEKPEYPSYVGQILSGLQNIDANWPSTHKIVIQCLSDLIQDPEVTLTDAINAELVLYKLEGKK